MNILQTNIQSINTSTHLLSSVINKYDVDVVLIQEVWKPKANINIHNFLKPILKLRTQNNYGGVGIFVRKNAKIVYRKEYEVDGLEAVWAEVKVDKVKVLCGSVYINVGKIREIDLLDKALEGIVNDSQGKIIIAMDANARSLLWDNNAINVNRNSISKKM